MVVKMLKEENKIFKNLYNYLGWEIDKAIKREDWNNTKEIIKVSNTYKKILFPIMDPLSPNKDLSLSLLNKSFTSIGFLSSAIYKFSLIY